MLFEGNNLLVLGHSLLYGIEHGQVSCKGIFTQWILTLNWTQIPNPNLCVSAHNAEFSGAKLKSALRKKVASLLDMDSALDLPIKVSGKLKICIQSAPK